MSVTVAAFYADIPSQASRFDEYLPLMIASKHALSVTNPGARYVVLTDNNTEKLFVGHGIECCPIAIEYMPLMSKIIHAQKSFVKTCDADLIVLPDVDCLANRDLSDSIPMDTGMAITHRGKKFEYKINNLAYIRDRGLGYWFLDKAYDVLDRWPLEKRLWDGDQEAWQAALEPASLGEINWYNFEDLGGDVLVSRPDGRDIYLYPCRTHNCFMNDAGIIKDNHRNAYMVHFKGSRKQHLGKWMNERFNVDGF